MRCGAVRCGAARCGAVGITSCRVKSPIHVRVVAATSSSKVGRALRRAAATACSVGGLFCGVVARRGSMNDILGQRVARGSEDPWSRVLAATGCLLRLAPLLHNGDETRCGYVRALRGTVGPRRGMEDPSQRQCRQCRRCSTRRARDDFCEIKKWITDVRLDMLSRRRHGQRGKRGAASAWL